MAKKNEALKTEPEKSAQAFFEPLGQWRLSGINGEFWEACRDGNLGKATALWGLCSGVKLEKFRPLFDWLLEQGADPALSDKYGGTPLAALAQRGWEDGMRELIARGAPLNIQDSQKRTPMVCALFHGMEKSAWLLLKAGADELIPDDKGALALHWACFYGYERLARELINRNPPSASCADLKGNQPGHWLLVSCRGKKTAPMKVWSLINQMMEAGADFEARNNDGKMANELVSREDPSMALQEALKAFIQEKVCAGKLARSQKPKKSSGSEAMEALFQTQKSNSKAKRETQPCAVGIGFGQSARRDARGRGGAGSPRQALFLSEREKNQSLRAKARSCPLVLK